MTSPVVAASPGTSTQCLGRLPAYAVLWSLIVVVAGCSGTMESVSTNPLCGRLNGAVTSGRIRSAALGGSIRWDARSAPWSPKSGDPADRPLLILLQGARADPSQWTDIGIDRAIKEMTVNRRGPSPVVVTPDVKAGTPLDAAQRFLAVELIPLARRCFGATDDPAHRAVGGISAGGRIALFVAAGHPDLFSVAGGHSPAVHTDEADALARDLAQAQTRVQLDAGSQDGFRPGTTALDTALHRRGDDAQLRIPPGQHDRRYWRAQLPSYLAFYFERI